MAYTSAEAKPQAGITAISSHPYSIAIVGAGLRGLASADYLQHAGAEVHIFEQKAGLGGVWQVVHAGARVNTPGFAYTFHTSNRWRSSKPSKEEILDNLERMVRRSNLQQAIQFNTPVQHIARTREERWTINGGSQEYDGVLVCPGFLGHRKAPAAELFSAFGGDLARAYEAEPDALRNRNVVVVGSGSSALDMLLLAQSNGCTRANLLIRPGVAIRDTGRFEPLKQAIASNPLIYRLTKRPGGRPAAVCTGIKQALKSASVRVIREEIHRVSEHHVHLAGGESIEADYIIWCTGWDDPMPAWVEDHPDEPTMVVAACKQCLDTSGFGFGSATVHAKALMATLEYELPKRFHSGTAHCDCAQKPPGFSRHILLDLVLYYLAQPGGWKLLGRELRRGFRSNLERKRKMEEPTWVSLLAFLNAPFGL